MHNNKEPTKKCIHLTTSTKITMLNNNNNNNNNRVINIKILLCKHPYSSLLKGTSNSICNLVDKKKKLNNCNKKENVIIVAGEHLCYFARNMWNV